jgi:hypothetical protein
MHRCPGYDSIFEEKIMRDLPSLPGTGVRTGHTGYSILIPVLFLLMAPVPVSASVLPDFNHFFITVANDAGPKYNSFQNGTYYVNFEGETRGQNAIHISTTPTEPYGQVTVTRNQSGTFYITDTGGKSYEDEVILMIAVNGTMPENFRIHLSSDGYTWVPNTISNRAPNKNNVNFVTGAVDETFTPADFIYGPQSWKPCGGPGYPLYDGQDPADTTNTFRLMFVDLNVGVLGTNFTEFRDRGAVKIRYTIENPGPATVFNVYSFCNLSNNGATMIAWTNRLNGTGRSSGFSGYTVIGEASPATTTQSTTRAAGSPFLPLAAAGLGIMLVTGRKGR